MKRQPTTSEHESLMWACRTLQRFICDEIESRNQSVGKDLKDYREAPREAFGAFQILRSHALRAGIETARGPDELGRPNSLDADDEDADDEDDA